MLLIISGILFIIIFILFIVNAIDLRKVNYITTELYDNNDLDHVMLYYKHDIKNI